jgi:hypothetical protein
MDLKLRNDYGDCVQLCDSYNAKDETTSLVVNIRVFDPISTEQPVEHWCYHIKCGENILGQLQSIDGCDINEIIERMHFFLRNAEQTQAQTNNDNLANAVWDYLKNNIGATDGCAVLTPCEFECVRKQIKIITINDPFV